MQRNGEVIRGVVAAAVTFAGAAWAQRGELPDTRPSVEDLVARLDDPLFAVREEAGRDLLEHPEFTSQQAEWMLTDPSLSPEQRLRIQRAAFEIFARGPRAAMGVRFSQAGNLPRIEEPLDDFPAARVLASGDVFVEADGMPIVDQASMRAAILSHSPEETIRIAVLRGGERRELDVPLGSFAHLRGSAPPSAPDLLAAWRLRRARAGESLAVEALAPVADAGARAARVPERESELWDEVFGTADAPEGLVLGGQARESADLSLRQLAARDDAWVREERGFSRGQGNLQQQLDIYRAQLLATEQAISQLGTRLAQTPADDPNRAGIERDLAQAQARRMVFLDQIRALDAAAQPNVPRR